MTIFRTPIVTVLHLHIFLQVFSCQSMKTIFQSASAELASVELLLSSSFFQGMAEKLYNSPPHMIYLISLDSYPSAPGAGRADQKPGNCERQPSQ